MGRIFTISLALFLLTTRLTLGQNTPVVAVERQVDIKSTISIQGMAVDSNGQYLPNSERKITFKIYDPLNSKKPIWTKQKKVSVKNGYFTSNLGSPKTLGLPVGKSYWLDVEVGDNNEFAALVRLNSVHENRKNLLYEEEIEPIIRNISMLDLFVDSLGNVGIGTINPTNILTVKSVVDDGILLTSEAIPAGTDSSVFIKVNSSGHGQIVLNSAGAEKLILTSLDNYTSVSTDQEFRFYVNNDQRATIQTNGNVGIGTTTPSEVLEVVGKILASGQIRSKSKLEGYPTYSWDNDDDTGMYSPGPDTLGFSTGGNARLTISSIGYVGIGTTSPEADLHISQSKVTLFDLYVDHVTGAGVHYRKARGTKTSPLVVQADDIAGMLKTSAYNGSSFKTIGNIQIRAQSVSTDSIISGMLKFRTADTLGVMQTRLSIYNNGNAKFYGRVAISSDSSNHDLTVGNSPVYSYMDAGDENFHVPSSRAIKENIKDITIDLSKFSDIKPMEFNFKKNKIKRQFDPNKIDEWQIYSQAEQDKIRSAWIANEEKRAERLSKKKRKGFIAEEFGKLFGRTNDKEIYGGDMVIAMWLKIQELEKRIKELEARR